MSVAAIGMMVRKRTRERLGVCVSPHLFRDAVATFIVEMKPQWAMMAAAALQHTDYRITEKHYIHGQQHRAGRLYQVAICDLVRDGRG
jgi:integrase